MDRGSPASTTADAAPLAGGSVPLESRPPERGDGVELLGRVHGGGYRRGAYLVRRSDGQTLQLGPLMYGLLEEANGARNVQQLADALSDRLGRPVGDEHVTQLCQKLAGQGLLAGTEHHAPPRRNPLLALRWKVLVTNPKITRTLTTPFTVLFKPWLMWPVLACFAVICWYVLVDKGMASATAEAFQQPGLFLLVFLLAIASAGFHELGHAAAARYGGATPGGMGMGLYLVWPAFYTDVTDAYRLPKRDRLRVDFAGLYFNAVVAVATFGVWLALRVDALLLLVGLQLLQMVKQLSPVIRADGYHILADATGVPDLFAQMRPTLRGLLPAHHGEPSPLTRRARLLITLWVLVVVPVMLALVAGAVLLLPHLAASAWASGSRTVATISPALGQGHIVDVLAAGVSLLALMLPVLGSVLITQRVVRTTLTRACRWSSGHLLKRVVVLVASLAVLAGLAFAWWPQGQYQPVRADAGGTLGDVLGLAPGSQAASLLTPGKHLAVSMIPRGGATPAHPAIYIIQGSGGGAPVELIDGGSGTVAFPFILPPSPGPGDTQALAIGTQANGVTYDIAYSLVVVPSGSPVTNSNSAYALADCNACTTVAVSFQLVLVVGQTQIITPTNGAMALNDNCPACSTTAVADQMVVTLTSQPSQQLLTELQQALAQLNALPALGSNGTTDAVAAAVAAVQQAIQNELNQSGLLANPAPSATPAVVSAGPSPSITAQPSAGPSASASPAASPATVTPSPAASPSPSP